VQVYKKIDNLEEKLLSGVIDNPTYTKWNTKLISERSNLEYEVQKMLTPIDNIWNDYEASLPALADTYSWYQKSDTLRKQSFVKQVFQQPAKLWTGHLSNTLHSPDV
jgi:hypothetical protein